MMPPVHTAEELARRPLGPLERAQRALHASPAIAPALVLLLAIAAFAMVHPRFASPTSLSLVLQQVAVIAALAAGQTLVVLTAGIDLSVGAITILSMMVMATLAADQGVPAPFALAAGILLGVVAGTLNGLLVAKAKLPPFIATLGMLGVFTALGLLYSQGQSIPESRLPPLLNQMGATFPVGPFRITLGVLLVLVLYAVLSFALSQTAWGTHVYAVGDDAEAARLAGIRVNAVLVGVYALAGLIDGLAAWVLIGRAGAASPNAIAEANLESITAVVIGGVSLFGGRGSLVGALLGALTVGVLRSGLSFARVDDQYRVMAVGLLVILAVAIDQWIRKVRG
ncbi:MAG TPA: ABC transporter permease [Vicinamibacteria bacterium]|nr:ABC transporter permease [Vicinamibacteria bacterium]